MYLSWKNAWASQTTKRGSPNVSIGRAQFIPRGIGGTLEKVGKL